MGNESTYWGNKRIQLGYAEPFQINYVEVGNEDNLNGGDGSYSEYRFPMFYDAIHAAYPNITVIGSTVDIFPTETDNNAAGDYHQYTRPDYFVGQFNYFDNFTADHPVLIGEYAVVQPNVAEGGGVNWNQSRSPFPFWIGSVSEAVFLIGIERNADKVIGASYAPTFQNLNSYQWVPDLISYTADPSQDVLSTSHHMIALLSGTRMTETLPAPGEFDPVYWVAGRNNNTGSYILKAAVYNSTGDVPMTVNFPSGSSANLTILTAPDGNSYNDIGSDIVSTNTTTITGNDGTFSFSLPNLSIAVLETISGGASGYGRRWTA